MYNIIKYFSARICVIFSNYYFSTSIHLKFTLMNITLVIILHTYQDSVLVYLNLKIPFRVFGGVIFFTTEFLNY